MEGGCWVNDYFFHYAVAFWLLTVERGMGGWHVILMVPVEAPLCLKKKQRLMTMMNE